MGKPIVFITGASRGIGRNMALFFAEKDYIVIGTGRNEERLNELQAELVKISTGHQTFVMDVTKPEEISRAIEKVIQEHGQVDVWINNAGAFKAIGPTWEVKAEDWLNDVQTNLFGTFHSLQAIIPVMLEQKSGRIVNVAGGGTVGTFKYGNGYGTSKTAVARLTENVAAELEETKVKVFALDPGLNDTDMTRYQRDTVVGQRYLNQIEELFEKNHDVPPEQAPQWAYYMASGKLDPYAGRVVSVYEDVEKLQDIAEEELGNDFHRLRLFQ